MRLAKEEDMRKRGMGEKERERQSERTAGEKTSSSALTSDSF